jgi:hypothetical protein
MAFENSVSLRTPGQKAERQVAQAAGIDALQPGGFRLRDELRQRISEEEHMEKRKKRAFNMAYRQAIRSGDRRGALDILLGAEKRQVHFGGIQAAGRDRERVAVGVGEDLLTDMMLKGQGGQAAQPGVGPMADAPLEEGGAELADVNRVMLGGGGAVGASGSTAAQISKEAVLRGEREAEDRIRREKGSKYLEKADGETPPPASPRSTKEQLIPTAPTSRRSLLDVERTPPEFSDSRNVGKIEPVIEGEEFPQSSSLFDEPRKPWWDLTSNKPPGVSEYEYNVARREQEQHEQALKDADNLAELEKERAAKVALYARYNMNKGFSLGETFARGPENDPRIRELTRRVLAARKIVNERNKKAAGAKADESMPDARERLLEWERSQSRKDPQT